MPPLTPEQQAFAEEHHGLILDFMEKHSLDDDYYGLLKLSLWAPAWTMQPWP